MIRFIQKILSTFKQEEKRFLGNFSFIDPIAQTHFEKNGFVKLQLLEEQDINKLEDLFHRYVELEKINGVYDSMDQESAEVNLAINQKVSEIISENFNKHLNNFQLVCSVFFVKNKSKQSKVSLHIDPSLTTEQYHHLGVWIPLVDIHKENGPFYLLKNSQKLLPKYYHPSMPAPYLGIASSIEPLMQEILFTKGEILFFDNSLVHYTGANLKESARIALILKLIDKNAPLVTVSYNKESKEVKAYKHHQNVFLNGDFKRDHIPEDAGLLRDVSFKSTIFREKDLPKIIKMCCND